MPTPADFIWGVAIASHQNEGTAPAGDWAQPDAEGRYTHACGEGARFREHYAQDLDLVAHDLGAGALRTSIEWARLEPTPGTWDSQEIAYLHRVFDAARARGLKLVVTLHHFTSPLWIYDGKWPSGWESPRIAEAFARYATFVAQEFGDAIDYYLTFNEPSNLLVGGYLGGRIPPFRWGPLSFFNAMRTVLKAHKLAYDAIHAVRPGAKVTLTEYTGLFAIGALRVPYEPGRLLMAQLPRGADGKPMYTDFTSLHYYGDVPVHETGTYPLRHHLFGVTPKGFSRVLRKAHQLYGLPILVAECGLATFNHDPREDGWTASEYMVTHIKEMESVMAEGIPILGFLWWTLTDNYEWGTYNSRFGLYRVDCHAGNYERVATPTVEIFRRIVAAGGVPAEL